MNMAAKVTMARSFSFHIHISLVVRIFRFHRKDRGSIPLGSTIKPPISTDVGGFLVVEGRFFSSPLYTFCPRPVSGSTSQGVL